MRLAQTGRQFAIGLILLLLLLAACNCSGTSSRSSGLNSAAVPAAGSNAGFTAPFDGALLAPARFASAQQYPADVPGKDFLSEAGAGNVAVDGAEALFTPQEDGLPPAGLGAAAYCVYGLGLDSRITEAALTLAWNGAAPAASQAWLGLSDRRGGAWSWRQLWGSQVALSTAQRYADSSGNLYAALVVLGTRQCRLQSIGVSERLAGVSLLGRPSDHGVSVSVLGAAGARCYVEYGTASGQYTDQSPQFESDGVLPQTVDLAGLAAGTRYFYRVQQRPAGAAEFQPGTEFTFCTARPPGSSFVFAVQADPHLDDRTSAQLYELTLANISADQPDFLLDLGDNFMLDKMGHPTAAEITERLRYCRSFYAESCHSVPLLLVQGNHDGEQGWLNRGLEDNLAVAACQARLAWYPAPLPDGFYSCAPEGDPVCGQRGGYYAWQWGDALLVVLDPYWYTATKPQQSGDNWDWTLGREQYDWLKQVLRDSQAKYKLVFIHHLVGGSTTEGRGGVEAAPYYEWGGRNADGAAGFDERRPGWGEPIHDLLVENGVDAVIHGHDHFYCRQELDGMVYQLVPQPGSPILQPPRQAEEYGYLSGTTLPGSGHLRITVAPESLTVEFIQAVLPGDESAELLNGRVADRYVIE